MAISPDQYKGASRTRIICPSCGGGSSKEKSFSLTTDNEGNSFGKCFRNTCGYTERNGHVGLVVDRPPVTRPQLNYMSATIRGMLDSYGVKHEGFYETECGYLYHPIKDILGRTYGYGLKGWNPKYNRVRFERDNEGAWVGKGSTVVIVEDYLSACRIAQTGAAKGCSLSGTEMSRALINVLKDQDVVVALDKDAWLKTLEQVNKLQGWCKSVKALPLEKDVKNMNEDELKELVSML